MIYRQKKFDADLRTDIRTDIRTDGRTDMSAYRVALQFYWTRLKMTLTHVLETISVKYHQNRPSCLGCGAVTHKHTDRQRHRQTGSILTYSVKMTQKQPLETDPKI